jgi:hypothetical protein
MNICHKFQQTGLTMFFSDYYLAENVLHYEYKCSVCGIKTFSRFNSGYKMIEELKAHIVRFKDTENYEKNDLLTCDEYIIKNIIE